MWRLRACGGLQPACGGLQPACGGCAAVMLRMSDSYVGFVCRIRMSHSHKNLILIYLTSETVWTAVVQPPNGLEPSGWWEGLAPSLGHGLVMVPCLAQPPWATGPQSLRASPPRRQPVPMVLMTLSLGDSSTARANWSVGGAGPILGPWPGHGLVKVPSLAHPSCSAGPRSPGASPPRRQPVARCSCP